MKRSDGRKFDELRNVNILQNYINYAEGSVLIEMGKTKVICTATVEETVPFFKKYSGTGWVSAEYSMLPRATQIRNQRDIVKLKQNPRSVEIQRLIGRALRSSIDLKKLGERSIFIDCDVIQADGGTRCAAITGGFIALASACNFLVKKKKIVNPIIKFVAAVSVGIFEGEPILDLCYEEDSKAFVDMNIVMNNDGNFIEIQGTGENDTFSYNQLTDMLQLARGGIEKLISIQKEVFTLCK